MTNLNGTPDNGFKYDMEAFTAFTNANPTVMNGVWQMFLNNDAYLKMIVESVTNDVEVLNNWKTSLDATNFLNSVNTRLNALEQSVNALDARLDSMSSGGGSGGGSGITFVETSSAAWTVANPDVVPRNAYLYIQPPAGKFAVPVKAVGQIVGDLVQPGFMGDACQVMRRLGSGETYETPTTNVTITWAVLGDATAGTPSTPVTQWTAFTGSGNLYVSNMAGERTNNSVKTFAITRPAAAPAGSLLRVSGHEEFLGNGGHYSYMTLVAVVNGAEYMIGTTPATSPSGENFTFNLPNAAWMEGDWTLRCRYSITSNNNLNEDMDAGLDFTLEVKYLAP